MLAKRLRPPRGGGDVEVGVAIPIGCLAPLGVAIALLVGAGVVVGTHLGQSGQSSGPAQVTVRLIDDGAAGGPTVVSTQVVPLR